MAPTGKTHTGLLPAPGEQRDTALGTAPSHPHPSQRVRQSAAGSGRSSPPPPCPWWPWGVAPLSAVCRIGPRCQLLVSRVASLLPAGCRQLGTCLQPCRACLWGQHIPALFSPSSPFPTPAPCLSPSLRHKPAGDREGDQACEMAGNLPTPACSSLAILLTSPSPERIDASACELL